MAKYDNVDPDVIYEGLLTLFGLQAQAELTKIATVSRANRMGQLNRYSEAEAFLGTFVAKVSKTAFDKLFR